MSRSSCFMIRPIALMVGLGALAGAAMANPNLPTSSDGMAMPERLVNVPSQVLGNKGQVLKGQALDALAEFPAEQFSAAEMALFRATYKPKLPPYATDAVSPESVIGSDRRFRVYPQESGYPYRAIGQITFNQGTGSYICTGWLISPDTVATAGHCVHSGGSTGVWSTNVRFYPGRNGTLAPYGSCTAKRLNSVNGWTSSANELYDYGAIKLNCTIGNTTGWYGRVWTTASQVGLPITVIGYPGDKPSSTQWGGAGSITVSETRKTRYPIDTAGGQSGAPVVQTDGSGPSGTNCQGDCGVAIHAYAASGGNNSGTRITQAVSNNFQTWIDTP